MLIATVSLSKKDGGKIHSDISVNGQFTSKGGTVATVSDDQPDFGKITVTNVGGAGASWGIDRRWTTWDPGGRTQSSGHRNLSPVVRFVVRSSGV